MASFNFNRSNNRDMSPIGMHKRTPPQITLPTFFPMVISRCEHLNSILLWLWYFNAAYPNAVLMNSSVFFQIKDLSRVEKPMRIKGALDAPHEIDCIWSELFLQWFFLAEPNAMFTLYICKMLLVFVPWNFNVHSGHTVQEPSISNARSTML